MALIRFCCVPINPENPRLFNPLISRQYTSQPATDVPSHPLSSNRHQAIIYRHELDTILCRLPRHRLLATKPTRRSNICSSATSSSATTTGTIVTQYNTDRHSHAPTRSQDESSPTPLPDHFAIAPFSSVPHTPYRYLSATLPKSLDTDEHTPDSFTLYSTTSPLEHTFIF